jgi:hypothetical protein
VVAITMIVLTAVLMVAVARKIYRRDETAAMMMALSPLSFINQRPIDPSVCKGTI